ncbi:glycoside hydrolase family 3 C-terminal domain-containing protein [Microbacterium sp. MYb66]|uniref:glycoside hydrolase family 3 C-terminal domain-containing protein n=1 Tax=Microbacterium sp. MYb66 TaxID=1848692 RepID=UPI000CFF84FF|nr:glycoside hydrolase family 3 C-terminal domain-containing protein [Microbacterium sp. MYb66]PRA79735.1 glycosyl hydrolase [Microbacterium sp. MYb66]
MTEPTFDDKARLVAGASTWKTVDGGPGLPPLLLADGPHGLRSQGASGDSLGIGDSLPAVAFPPAVALGSTWNVELVERVGRALGDECRRLGVNVLLGPGMNIKRSPLGGRNFEYLSEDPRLTGTLASALVRGIQSRGVAATPKHFAVNNQETDRMRVDAIVGERALREIYLAGFEQVVREAKPWAMMSAYNRINGTFASESRHLLEDILRGEWGFDGLVMSDWGAVDDPAAAVSAGLDLEMPPSGRHRRIVDALTAGELDEAVVDTSIERLRVLAARTTEVLPVAPGPAAELVAAEAAREAITLLENDGILPLTAEASTRVLVIGEFARTPRFQGGGSSRVRPTRVIAALDVLRELSAATIDFAAGFTLDAGEETALADAAVEAASSADVLVLFLGLPDHAESEGFDRSDMLLPADQLALLERLKRLDVPIVVALSNGSVIDIAGWRDGVAAIVEGWLLGQEGGTAIAEVLVGHTNPSGRLAESIPLRLEDSPSHLTFPGQDSQVIYGDDIYVGYRSYDSLGTPVAYPFGHGLSYTRFSHDGLVIADRGDNCWSVQATIRNIGDRDGAEVVQLYIASETDRIRRPVHELRGFTKVHLAAGEEKTVSFDITPRDLSYWNARTGRWQLEPGNYRVEIGASSRDIRLEGTISSAGDGVIDPLRTDSTLAEWARNPVSARVLDTIKAGLPAGLAEKAPELVAMVQATPVMKLTTWGLGLTEDIVHDVVAQANGALGADTP